MKYLNLLLGVYLIVIINGCVRSPCGVDGDNLYCWVEYDVALAYESDPHIREISIGDTFTISMEIPHMVEDTETGEIYDFYNLNYFTSFSIGKMNLNDKTFQSAPTNTFEYYPVKDKGDITVSQLGDYAKVVNLAYDTITSKRIVSFKVVPKSVGLFFGNIYFDTKDLEEYDNVRLDLTDTCCLERVNLSYEYVSVGNKNIDLIPDITNWGEKLEGWDTAIDHKDLDNEDWTKYGIFYFRVVE